jgi:hypothetical protein
VSAYITYVDKNTYPHWTYTAPGATQDITLTSSLWLAYNNDDYLSYSAVQDDGGKVDFCRASNYTFARSRDNTVRTIENVTTDGTVAMVTKIPFTHNLHAVDVTTVTYGAKVICTSSVASSFSIVYTNTSQFNAWLDPDSSPVTVKYYDLPSSWLPLNASLISVELTQGK